MYKYAPHRITPNDCVHHAGVQATYQHEFFECGSIIPRMWRFTNLKIDRLQLPEKLASIVDLHHFMNITGKADTDLRVVTNQNLVINTLKATWIAYQRKHELTHGQHEKELVKQYNTLLHTEFRMLRMHRYNAFKHGSCMMNGRLKKRFTERDKSTMSFSPHAYTQFPQRDLDACKALWGPSRLMTFDDQLRTAKLTIPPWHLPLPIQPPIGP